MQNFQCSHCNSTFGRREHLARHILRHSGRKPFTCHVCPRQFSRRDALQRHLRAHGVEVSKATEDSTRRRHACLNCARAKQRCPGGEQCARCREKGQQCEYKAPTPVAASPPPPPTVNDDNMAMTPLPTPEEAASTIPASTSSGSNTAEAAILSAAAATVPGEGMEHDFNNLSWVMPSLNHLVWMPDLPEGSYTDLEWFLAPEPSAATGGLPPGETELSQLNHPVHEPSAIPSQTHLLGWLDHYPERFLPEMTLEDQKAVLTDISGHLHHVPPGPFARLTAYFAAQDRNSNCFVDVTTFQSFVELYLENFAEYFPILHVSRLVRDDVHWILLLATASIGAQYSSLKHASLCAGVLQDLLQQAVKEYCPETPSADDPTWAQIILLRDICMLFNGGKGLQMSRQFEKHKLLTFCHVLASADSARTSATSGVKPTHIARHQDWGGWIMMESRFRLLHGVYFLECLQFILHDLRPGLQLEDLTNRLPCHDDLWRCRNEVEWKRLRAERPELAGTQESLGLQADWDTSTETGGYKARLLFVYIYSEERLLMERLRSSPLRQALYQHDAPTPCEQLGPGLGPGITSLHGLLSSMRASAGNELKRLDPQDSSAPLSALAGGGQDIIFPLLLLLRDVPMRTLLAFSGWQANEAQIEHARLELSSWMSRRQRAARRGLYRAVVIFNTLRDKRTFAPYDAFALLTAGLYIWAYDKHFPPYDQGVLGDEGTAPATLRLGRLADARASERWIEVGGSSYIYITGVGILDGGDSRLRMLQELRGILITRTEWSVVCQVIGKALTRMIQQRRPQFEEDVTLDTGRF